MGIPKNRIVLMALMGAAALTAFAAEPLLREGVKDGSAARAWLGISIQTVNPALADALDLKARKGALVTLVAEGGPGATAGLKRGDVILAFNEAGIGDAGDLLARAAEVAPGKEADLTLMRGIKTLEVTVKVGRKAERDSGSDGADGTGSAGVEKDRIGLRVTEPDKGLRRRYGIEAGNGVVVLAVEPGGLGGGAGIEEGDFIVEANGRAVATPRALKAEAARAKRRGNGKLVLLVKRGEDAFYAALRFPG